MEICYLSFWIKTNMQSMQMHKLQINETQTRKLTIQNLRTSGMWKRQFLNRFRFQLDRLGRLPILDDIIFALNSLS